MRQFYISADTNRGVLSCLVTARNEREAIREFSSHPGTLEIFDICAVPAAHIPGDLLTRAGALPC